MDIIGSKQLKFCCRSLIPDRGVDIGSAGTVKILKKDADKFSYSGLMTCGSVWVCPICATKVTERRRVELVQGVDSWDQGGGGIMMLTLTVPHYTHNDALTVLGGLSDAFRCMTNRKPFKRLVKGLGYVGRVRTLEVTSGYNGWHPHFHILLFTEQVVTDEYRPVLESALLEQWQSACYAAKLPRPNEHGLTLQDGSKAARYASKWGVESEMTKGHLKKGIKKGHVSPFGLLQMHIDGDKSAAPKFREYAGAFRGKRQLVWSDGLRDLLGLGVELSDEILAAVPEVGAVLFETIPLNVWKCVLARHKRGEVLEVCKGGLEALQDYLINLMHDSDFKETDSIQP